MTSAEKAMVLERVMKAGPVKIGEIKGAPVAIKSPWTVYSFGKWIQTHRSISALAIVIIVILAGKSAVSASRNALPGDTLYSMKVNVVEPIRVAFAETPIVKAEIQTELVQNRLQEAETLAARGQLDMMKEQDINQRIGQQVSDLTANISEVKKTSSEKADDITTTLEASINTHGRILDVIAMNRGEVRSNGNERVSAASATATMVAPMTAPGVTTSAAAPSVSTPSAPEESPRVMRTASTLRKTESSESKDNSNKNYSKKKESVDSLIQATTADVASATTTATSSLLQETIVNEARNTLDRAQEKLQEAQNHNSNGNSSEAYSALIDSERATKEAALFIKAKARLEKEGNGEELRKSNNDN